MSNAISITKDVLRYLEGFISEKGREPSDIQEFILWTAEQVSGEDLHNQSYHQEGNTDMELAYLLVMQGRHFKMYSKEILHDTALSSPDEYSFLYHLSLAESYRKMELIHIHMLEGPSGIEVIKRLLRKGLISEFDDAEDKRAKRVRITEEGAALVSSLVPKMQTVYEKMGGEMTLREKLHAIYFLKTLNEYHEKEGKN